MAEIVNVGYQRSIGSAGQGVGELYLPVSATVLDNVLYVADRGRMQILAFDALTGDFLFEFFAELFPYSVTTDGAALYIGSFSGLGKYSASGELLVAANAAFIQQINATYYDGYIYAVALSYTGQSVLYKYDTDLNLILTKSGNGFAQDIANVADEVLIARGTSIDYYDLDLNYLRNESYNAQRLSVAAGRVFGAEEFKGWSIKGYPDMYAESQITGIHATTDRVYTVLWYPASVKVYIYDIQNVEVQNVGLLTRTLQRHYPTGRAFKGKRGGVFDKLHTAIAKIFGDILTSDNNLLNAVIPDNEGFTAQDAANWERALGMVDGSAVKLTDRKKAIFRKMQHPHGQPNRQHYMFIQHQLQQAGFDVYIHENRFADGQGGWTHIDPRTATLGTFLFGEELLSGANILGGFDSVANYIDKSLDRRFTFGTTDNMYATFFVGGAEFGSRAVIPAEREAEFRHLLLTLKPAHTIGAFMLTDFTVGGSLEYETGGALALESDSTDFVILETELIL